MSCPRHVHTIKPVASSTNQNLSGSYEHTLNRNPVFGHCGNDSGRRGSVIAGLSPRHAAAIVNGHLTVRVVGATNRELNPHKSATLTRDNVAVRYVDSFRVPIPFKLDAEAVISNNSGFAAIASTSEINGDGNSLTNLKTA